MGTAVTDGEAEIPDIGAHLLSIGWRQGALFTATQLQHAYNAKSASSKDDAGSSRLVARHINDNESLVVVSQDCDIKASLEVEPYLEALVCYPETDSNLLNNYDRNSARYFVVDRSTGLVARARDRVILEKELAINFTPRCWPSDSKRFERFVRWLGRRYDRPAIPDPIVEAFQWPFDDVLRKLSKPEMDLFTAAIHEIRISLPPTDIPPYEINVLLMARRDDLKGDEADTIEALEKKVRARLDRNRVTLRSFGIKLESELSVEEYFATRPLFEEYRTYKGDEIHGSEPSPRY